LLQIDDKIIKLQIWDTAGQESFKSLNKIFYRGTCIFPIINIGSHWVFLVYDLTREETFHNVADWLREVKMNTGNDCMTYLVGNQVDNEDAREVSIEKANIYAREAGISHVWETSAKTGERVEDIFITAAKMLYAQNKHEIEEKVSDEELFDIDTRTIRTNVEKDCK
jgi:GTPase SAR1 family protein